MVILQRKSIGLLALVVALALSSGAQAQLVNPYTTLPGTAGTSPTIPVNPYQFSPGMNPYQTGYGYGTTDIFGFGAGGQTLSGLANVYNSVATLTTSQEYARILREQAMQAKIDTARKRFDYSLYVRANTPTLADEQKRIVRNTLRRVQIASLPAEISSGKSLNILLDDIRNFPLKKASLETIPLSPYVLGRLNVTTKNLGVGILRDGGKLDWPTLLQEILPPEQRQAIDQQTQTLVANAAQGKIDRQLLDDLNARMTEAKNVLAKKINDGTPFGRTLEADQFLSDFRDARQAVGEGQMEAQVMFKKFVEGGNKTVQEVTDFMVANGLRFAPGTGRDEAPYRAIHSALVNFDIALNTQEGEAKATNPSSGNP